MQLVLLSRGLCEAAMQLVLLSRGLCEAAMQLVLLSIGGGARASGAACTTSRLPTVTGCQHRWRTHQFQPATLSLRWMAECSGRSCPSAGCVVWCGGGFVFACFFPVFVCFRVSFLFLVCGVSSPAFSVFVFISGFAFLLLLCVLPFFGVRGGAVSTQPCPFPPCNEASSSSWADSRHGQVSERSRKPGTVW